MTSNHPVSDTRPGPFSVRREDGHQESGTELRESLDLALNSGINFFSAKMIGSGVSGFWEA